MEKMKKDTNKILSTDFGVIGKLLDDASRDLPNKFASFLDSVEEGFKEFFSPSFVEKD